MSPLRGEALSSGYSHELLLHDDDETLIRGTRAFVNQGLAAGGHVLVHGTPDRVTMMRDVLGSPPNLEYALDQDLYSAPLNTLFRYQRALAEGDQPTQLWATGTVPFASDPTAQATWSRFESLVNEALGGFAFHGLCTYDTRALPPSVIAAARATHPSVSTDTGRAPSPEYRQPAAFLDDPAVQQHQPPLGRPSVAVRIYGLRELVRVRELVRGCATASSAVPTETINDFVTAVNEVTANGIVHGAPPVDITLWVALTGLTCLIEDSGPGMPDPLVGYRYPDATGPMGLWAARQLCRDITVRNRPGGGCDVLLSTS
jgi:anti-sigma regulatory factor (Ser/Thr protein kinase)